jgi:hypothetical protein
MKTLAFTRFRDKPELLETWLKYYSKYFDELCVFGHRARGFPIQLAQKYVFTYENTQLDLHGIPSLEFLSTKQVEFLKNHTWVFYSDMDEIVIADPLKYKDLKDYMLKSEEKQPFCEGFELFRIEVEGEGPIDRSKPILQQRKHWWKSVNGSYNKNTLSKIPSHWVHGFHYLQEMYPNDVKKICNTGLYLIHLKHVDDKQTLDGVTEEGGTATFIPEEIRRIF